MMAIVQVIEALKQAIQGGQFSERGSEEYNKLNASYLSGLESDFEPSWIFQPKSKEEVAIFLKTVKPHIDLVMFAVRGGGQQPLPGCANIQNGITVDLRLITGVDIKDNVVQIGAGERWGKVYEVLDNKGLGVAGGRSAVGGIGGLALQGALNNAVVVVPLLARSPC